MEPDFSGWATKALLRCSDGRTIMPDAFKHQDQVTVPLVYMHGHTNIENVLGHAILENREEGVWVDAYFNESKPAKHARDAVNHGDITQLSIWANGLVEKAKNVVHGVIREVSLVLSGANPGALIQNVNIRHSDGTEDELDDEVIIYTGLPLQHSSHSPSHSDGDTVVIPDTTTTKTGEAKIEDVKMTETKQDIYDSLDDKQKSLVHGMIAKALDESVIVEENKEETPQETYDSMNDKQKEMVHSMLSEALELSELSHADDDDLTVGDVYERMSEEKKQLVHFMIGQAISGDKGELKQSDMELEHAEGGKTVKDVYDSMTEVEKQVLHFMVGEALAAAGDDAKHSDIKVSDIDDNNENNENNNDKEGQIMHRNVFEGAEGDTKTKAQPVLSHDAMQAIMTEAKESGSFKSALEGYALSHGIEDIDVLFPDATAIENTPEFLQRRTEWVQVFLGGARKVPFSRIKSFSADLTEADARAKGYIKGSLKKEEFFKVSKRVTLPTTIYKKQKLDRDDMVDITDFDIVVWLKAEMRLMLDEEIARAGLLGDGRDAGSDEKVNEESIRPVATDHELYAVKVYVNLGDANSSIDEVADAIIRERSQYKGSGNPVLFTTENIISRFLILKDTVGRRVYSNLADLQAVLRVSKIVPVEVMESYPNIIGILVNPADYTFGATRGGEVTNFEDFDIDYNQYKYLAETRCSGTLTKLKSAIVFIRTADNAVLVTPAAPTFDPETGELTITDTTGAVYKNQAGTTLNAAGSPYTVPTGTTWTVTVTPASSAYYIEDSSVDDGWDFTAE